MAGTRGRHQLPREAPAKPRGRRSAVPVLVALLTAAVAVPIAAAADTSAPTQPGRITTSNITSSGASLKWGGSSDDVAIEGYRVYRGPAAAADTALTLIATTDAITSYPGTKLRSGYAYKFGIVAIDAGNNKSPMRTTTFTTLTSSDSTAPAAVASTSVSLTPFSSSRIDVLWGATTSSDIAYYEVARDGSVVGTVEQPNSQRYSDNGLAASSRHSYTVRAVDSAGNRSAASTAKSATTTAAGVVKIARGPYLSAVTGTSGVVSWWTNIATPGTLTIGGQTISDPAGTVQHHTVTVSGLTPGTAYPYTVKSGAISGTGTLRTAATPTQTFSFAAIGDFGGQSTAEAQNASNIGAAGTDFIQTLGDNVYPSAGLPDPNFTTTYSDFDARFYKQFGRVVKSQAFFPANGNKEYYGDGAFWANFPMPGGSTSWYSYNWGSAHILVLDSEQPIAPGSDQYAFAKADLAAHQSDAWRIAAIQKPPYSSTSSNSSFVAGQQYLVPLFQTQHVNLVLSGNSHNYERSFPLKDGVAVTNGGITYLVSGAGGNGFTPFVSPQPAWSAYREATFFEYAKVTVSPTTITVDGIRADTNAVFDSTTITNPSSDTVAPGAPAGLAAGTPTASSVPLSWSANPAGDGVTGYTVYRNDVTAPAGTALTGTTFTDTGLAASTTYSYRVTAVDGAGNESAKSAAVSVTTQAGGGGGGGTLTLAPSNDATIDPATATPTNSRLKVDASSPVNDTLLKFTVPSSCTSIAAASLQLTVGSGTTDPSAHGGDFFATSAGDANAGWTEASVTWATAPAKSASIASVPLGAVTAGTTYTVNVTSLVPAAGGTFTIRASSTSGDGAGYFSKEGSSTSGPTLQLTCS